MNSFFKIVGKSPKKSKKKKPWFSEVANNHANKNNELK